MIQRVQQGDTITADKTNELVAAGNRFLRVFGNPNTKTTENGEGTTINSTWGWNRKFDRQYYLEPFDLSVDRSGQANKLKVMRPHLYLSGDTFYTIPNASTFEIELPQRGDTSVILSADVSGTLTSFGLTTEQPSGDNKGWCLWTVLSNGVVSEDLRTVALAGASNGNSGGVVLDLSSLDWNGISAQLWHYNNVLPTDIADKGELTANNGWLFPVRPPDGEPHLKYVELSTLSSITGGGGGGGHCSCDLSVTPPAVLSSLGQDLVQIADWTKDGWQTHVPILAPDVAKDVVQLFQWMAMTPFWYNQATHKIQNNYFYNGRTFTALADVTVSNSGYYYLKIEDNIYGVSPSFTIIHSNTAPNAMQNTDTITYYALWTINADLKAQFDWRLTWMLPRYSN